MKALPFFIFWLLVSVASASFPPKGYNQYDDVVTSPDKLFSVKQCYKKSKKDWEFKNQLWIFDAHSQNGYCLIDSSDVAGYCDGIAISPDSRWLLRIKHICSGTYTTFLYRRGKGIRFFPVLGKSLGDEAWKFFAKQPGFTEEKIPNFHKRIDFEEWRGNRYLILNLSGLHIVGDGWDRWIIARWLCAFDLEKRIFLLLPDLIQKNKGEVSFKKDAAH